MPGAVAPNGRCSSLHDEASEKTLEGLVEAFALGVVLVSLGVLFEDALIAGAGTILGVLGAALEVVLGAAAVHGIQALF